MSGSIGTRLRQAIEDAQLSMRSFAKTADLHYRSVQGYVADNQKPGAEALLKIRKILHLNIDWLLSGEGSPYSDLYPSSPREATLGDIVAISEWIERFENPQDVADHIASFLRFSRRAAVVLEEHKMMADRLLEKQKSGDLVDIDLQELKLRELRKLYKREFGEPES